MNPAAILAVLDRYPTDERPIRSPIALGGGGGLSGSRLWKYAAPGGERVLRAWPSSTPGPERILRVHAWLRATEGLAFVPRPTASLDGSTVVEEGGCCWDVSPWMPGESASGSAATVGRVRAVLSALAEFHCRLETANSRVGSSPGLRVRWDELRRLTSTGFDAIAERLSTSPGDLYTPAAFAWLAVARAAAPSVLAETAGVVDVEIPLFPCLRDARAEHFLLSGEEVTGLIDFGAMDVESAGADLARLLGEWLPPIESTSLRSEGLDAYRRVRGLSKTELAVARSFEHLADVLIGERWVRWRFLEGRVFDDETAYEQGLARGIARVGRLAPFAG